MFRENRTKYQELKDKEKTVYSEVILSTLTLLVLTPIMAALISAIFTTEDWMISIYLIMLAIVGIFWLACAVTYIPDIKKLNQIRRELKQLKR